MIEAADGTGFSPLGRLWRIELPLAAPLILAGVRTSVIIGIGTATIGSTVGALTLGSPIIDGLSGGNPAFVLQGTVLVALFAVAVDLAFGEVERGWGGGESRGDVILRCERSEPRRMLKQKAFIGDGHPSRLRCAEHLRMTWFRTLGLPRPPLLRGSSKVERKRALVGSDSSDHMAGAGNAWRVGVLFSRKGYMQVPESEHFRGTALAIEEINLAGGVLGRPIEPVCYDPESSPELYRRSAEKLLTEDGISTIFGCCTSSSRKAILATVERRNALLWYPSLYEGFEYSPNVIYTGAAPNQNSLQLARYLFATYGRSFYLVGSDYIYPRRSNRIMRDVVSREGGEVVAETYVPVTPHHDQIRRVVEDIRRKAPSVVFSTVVGQGGQALYRIFREAGLDPRTMPIASLTMGEGEIRAIGPELCVGHITSAPYFSTVATPGQSPLRRGLSRPFRPRCAGDDVCRGGLFPDPCVRRCAAPGEVARHPAPGGSRARHRI